MSMSVIIPVVLVCGLIGIAGIVLQARSMKSEGKKR